MWNRDWYRKLVLTKAVGQNPTVHLGEKGQFITCVESSSQHMYSSNTPITSPPFTISCFYRTADISNSQVLLSITDYNANWHAHYLEVSSSYINAATATAGVFTKAQAANTSSSNEWLHIVGVWGSSTDRRVYVDGGNKGSDSTSSSPSGIDYLTVGGYYEGSTFGTTSLDGDLANIIIWDRAFSDAEALHLHQNPWDLYQPVSPKIYPGAWVDQPEQVADSVHVPIAPYLIKQKSQKPPAGSFRLNRKSPLARGLVLWVPMTDISYHDRQRNRVFTPYNTPTWMKDGKFGNVISFVGASEEYLKASAVLTGTPITVSCWFYTTVTAIQRLVDITDESTWNQRFSLRAHSNYFLSGQIYATPGSDAAICSAQYSLNTWHHATAVFASSTSRACYMDGGNKGTNTTDLTPTGLDITTIGSGINTNSPWQPMTGRVSGVKIWNRALSDAEVEYDYQNPWDLCQPIPPKVYPSVYTEPPAQIADGVIELPRHRSQKP
jgi:hypothetical protein